jgi:hypothetical protein
MTLEPLIFRASCRLTLFSSDDFILWLGVAESDGAALPTNPIFVPIKQAEWHFHVDSSASTPQRPSKGASPVNPSKVPNVKAPPLANSIGGDLDDYVWKNGPQTTTISP